MTTLTKKMLWARNASILLFKKVNRPVNLIWIIARTIIMIDELQIPLKRVIDRFNMTEPSEDFKYFYSQLIVSHFHSLLDKR